MPAAKRECPGCGADLTGAHGNRKWCSRRCQYETTYAGQCERCGAKTTGPNGFGRAPQFCSRCWPKENAVWTKEAIIAAMHRWHALYGAQPVYSDWLPSLARR